MEKLTYEDLKLGEKAKEAFIKGKPVAEIMQEFPVYLNTRPFYANLNVTDAVVAAVLAPLNVLLVGDTGTGKTQLAQDIYTYFFGGNKNEGGQGVKVRAHPEIDIYNEIFTTLNIDRAQRELTQNIEALLFYVDELNRAPTVSQNQFFGLGDGLMDEKGASIKLGRDNYVLCIATANIGNGEFQGTFETDKALCNRLHIAVDFDYEAVKPLDEDRMLLDILFEANPGVKQAPVRDISDKIIQASREIAEMSRTLSAEENAVVNFLRFGLAYCQKYGRKEKTWPMNCQDCEHNADQKALCSMVRPPCGERTLNAVKRYAAALAYVARLKNPNQDLDSVDLMFRAFEMAGAYQHILNPMVLKMQYQDQNPKMMAEVASALRAAFKQKEDYIVSALHQAERGRKVTQFFEQDGQIGDYSTLSPAAKDMLKKKGIPPVEPFADAGYLGFSWVNDFADMRIKYRK